MKATQLLMDDHKQILRALVVLEQMVVRVEQVEMLNSDVKDIVRFLSHFADRHHHQGKEEGILFPALMQDRGQKNYRELRAMIFEHNQERSLVEGIEESIQTRRTLDFIFYAGRLVQILRAHIQKEDQILGGLVDSELSPQEDDRVARDLLNYEHVWKEKELPGLLHRLSEMESKYLGGSVYAPRTAIA